MIYSFNVDNFLLSFPDFNHVLKISLLRPQNENLKRKIGLFDLHEQLENNTFCPRKIKIII